MPSGSASGRLDLLGGVADYAGALVLEVPTSARTTVTATPCDRLVIGEVALTASQVAELARTDYPAVRQELDAAPKWTRYLLGVAVVLVRHGAIEPPAVRLTVESDVPQSAGVSSSAALEVATARALGAGDTDPIRLARLCQEAENYVVGAPCGAMDQIAVAAGTPGEVLPILCRPATAGDSRRLPPGIEVVGWPSGATHDVAASPYGRARAAAFMGKRILEDSAAASWEWISQLPGDLLATLPDDIDGSAFIDRWGTTGDALTTVDPDLSYPLRAAASFGGEEHARGGVALELLCDGRVEGIGPLMAASHAGYRAIGLGHPATDAVVEQALAIPGIHGARSSGGGAGGTVVVVCDRGALDHLEEIIR